MTTTTPNLGFQNWFSTTLSSGITATDTVIYLNSLPTPSEGFLVIEPDSITNREVIFYNSKGANFVTVPTTGDRGVGGTTAVSHSSGVTVQMNVVAEHFEALQDGTAFAVGGIGAAPYADGWTPILGSTPNTVTYNGNRNYDLVFNSVDLSSTLSPGMKLKATRTVAAPDQCADLEASSSQYFSKTSPAGMTFTDDFTVSAWVKLSSYPSVAASIASRYNGTSGWFFYVEASGQVYLRGANGGAGNVSQVVSYQSLPLNKWVHVSAQLDMSAFTATTTTSYVMFDGVDVPASVARAGTNPTALVQAGNLEIGSYNAGGFFPGKIAQVAIYNAKVTQANMRTYMSQGLSGSETSLISAYSFDNAITDLNTTNANNLTANGGAVATNADSPFANAVTAGLLEYAEINAVTFSTNTTVNVRVPWASMIPTSGGVSAVSYSTQSNPYGLPYFSKVLASVLVASNQGGITTITDLLGLSATVYIPTGVKVKISFRTSYANTLANTYTATYLDKDGSNLYTEDRVGSLIANTALDKCAYFIDQPISGFRTYKLRAITNSGTGTLTATAASPCYLTVELV